MTVPKEFAEFTNPVSVSYSPLVPIVSEASATPIPVTKKAAKEIQSGIPLGKIVSYIGNFAKKAASNPDFNALMGVVAQYLLNYVNEDNSNNNTSMMGILPPQPLAIPPPPPPSQNKSWFRRFHEYWNLSPAEKREQEYCENLQQQQYNQFINQYYNQQQQPQNAAAVQRSHFLTSAAPFVGRIANAYVPDSGDLVTSGLLALGKKLGFGRKKRRCCGGSAAGEKGAAKVKKKRNTFI